MLSTCLDFWILDHFVYEQPKVTHMNEMVLIVYTNEETFYAGTTNELNKLLSENRAVAGSIDIQQDDYNNDGKSEEIIVNVELTGVDPSEVKSVIVLQSLNYEIEVSNVTIQLGDWSSQYLVFIALGDIASLDEATNILNLPDSKRFRKAPRTRHSELTPEVSICTWRH